MNEYTFDEIQIGQKAAFTKVFSMEDENRFRELSGDENPLHMEDDFAEEISQGRFNRHVCYGMLTAALYSTLAGMYLPGKYSLIHSFDELSFKNPVYTGDTLKVEGEVFEKSEALKLIRLRVVIKNQRGQVVSRAKMKVLVLR